MQSWRLRIIFDVGFVSPWLDYARLYTYTRMRICNFKTIQKLLLPLAKTGVRKNKTLERLG